MNNDNYITILGWMRNEFGLKGNELLIYALIYGFTQDGQSEFSGSIRYLAEWTGTSRPTVHKTLKSLCEKELLEKCVSEKKGVKYCTYKVNLHSVKKLYRGSKETLQGVVKKLYRGSKETLHNKDSNNNSPDIDRTNNSSKATVQDVLEMIPEELRETAEAFVEHRKKLKAPMTGHALELAIKKAKKYANDDLDTTIAIMEQSIENGWKGIFELKDKKKERGWMNDVQRMDDDCSGSMFDIYE